MKTSEKSELSRFCKENCGIDAKKVAIYAAVPRRTFYGWWLTRRRAVELIVKGIALETSEND